MRSGIQERLAGIHVQARGQRFRDVLIDRLQRDALAVNSDFQLLARNVAEEATGGRAVEKRAEIVFAIGREVVRYGDAATCSVRSSFHMPQLSSGSRQLVDG